MLIWRAFRSPFYCIRPFFHKQLKSKLETPWYTWTADNWHYVKFNKITPRWSRRAIFVCWTHLSLLKLYQILVIKINTLLIVFTGKSRQNDIFNKSKCAFFDEKYVRFIKILRNTVEKLLLCYCRENTLKMLILRLFNLYIR